MSCLMMRKETTAELATYIAALLNMGFNFFQHEPPAVLFYTTRDCVIHGFASERLIYEKLYMLNVAAYNGRYKDSECYPERETVAPAIDDFNKYMTYERVTIVNQSAQVAPWHYRIAKLLDFWLYQTCEDVTEKSEFRLAIEELRRTLFDFIVQHTDTYKSIEWFDI